MLPKKQQYRSECSSMLKVKVREWTTLPWWPRRNAGVLPKKQQYRSECSSMLKVKVREWTTLPWWPRKKPVQHLGKSLIEVLKKVYMRVNNKHGTVHLHQFTNG